MSTCGLSDYVLYRGNACLGSCNIFLVVMSGKGNRAGSMSRRVFPEIEPQCLLFASVKDHCM